MKKILSYLTVFTFFLVTLIGCSNEDPKENDLKQLTRVDVQIFSGDNIENEKIITDEENIKTLREIFTKIVWKENVKAQMARKEDVKATLFFTFDKNMPERLVEYFIWFNEGDASGTIIDREKHSLGKLNKDDAQKLKDILMNN